MRRRIATFTAVGVLAAPAAAETYAERFVESLHENVEEKIERRAGRFELPLDVGQHRGEIDEYAEFRTRDIVGDILEGATPNAALDTLLSVPRIGRFYDAADTWLDAQGDRLADWVTRKKRGGSGQGGSDGTSTHFRARDLALEHRIGGNRFEFSPVRQRYIRQGVVGPLRKVGLGSGMYRVEAGHDDRRGFYGFGGVRFGGR